MEFPNFLAIYFKFCRTLSVLNVLAAVVHLISAVIQFVVSVIHHCQTQHNYTTHLTLCPISSSKSFIKHKEPKCWLDDCVQNNQGSETTFKIYNNTVLV